MAFRSRFLSEPRRLRGPVVSVGSLSAGGAGKTPLVILVTQMLQAAGCQVDVLSRGYGRSGHRVERVDPSGSAARFGDEPLMIAQRTKVPVWVGSDRHAAGTAAEEAGGPAVHVLDDGFQHRALHREVDIVLLTQRDVQDGLLPAGNLREPLTALHRAHIIVLREDEATGLREHLPPGKAVWVVRRSLVFEGAINGPMLAFCGLARPDGFLSMLRDTGLILAGTVQFPDHHPYGMRDITRLLAAARQVGAAGFVTTAKDAVKLTGAMRRRLEEHGPLRVAELNVDLLEGSAHDLHGIVQG